MTFATTTKNGAEQLKSAIPSISSSVQVDVAGDWTGGYN